MIVKLLAWLALFSALAAQIDTGVVPVETPAPLSLAPVESQHSAVDAKIDAAIQRWFAPGQRAMAWCIARAEHRGGPINPRAISQTNDHGVFQINMGVWWPLIRSLGYVQSDMLLVGPNVHVASMIQATARGWPEWATFYLCSTE